MKIKVLLLAAVLQLSAFSAVYYVDSASGNNGNPGSSAQPWQTIAYALGATSGVAAGDTVRVRVGSGYSASISPAVAGTLNSPINVVSDTPLGTTVTGQWSFGSGDNYIRVIGFICDGEELRNPFILSSCEGVEIWDNRIVNASQDGIRVSATSGTYANKTVVIGNTFSNCLSRITQFDGTNNFISFNKGYANPQDLHYVFGKRSWWLNNTGWSTNSTVGDHIDFFQTGQNDDHGLHNVTFEGSLYVDDATAMEHHHFINFSNEGTTSIMNTIRFRRNAMLRIGTLPYGIYNVTLPINRIKIIHDSMYQGNRYVGSANTTYGILFDGDGPAELDETGVHNTIAWKIWGGNVTTPILWLDPDSSDYNLGYDPDASRTFGNPFASEPNSIANQDPDFADPSNLDLQLQASSPAIGAAGPLATVTSASDTGDTFVVDDASWFQDTGATLDQYGGVLVAGDFITVGTDVRQIVTIVSNTITVSTNLTWANGDAVFWGTDTTPDMGAYPYSATDHTPGGTYSVSGTTITALPTGSFRYVILYADGIPVKIDDSSPYNYTGSGTLTAKVAALYPALEPLTALTEETPIVPTGAVVNGAPIFRGGVIVR